MKMQKKKQSAFQTINVDRFNCFFSEICEVSHSELQNNQIAQTEIMNSFISYQSDEIFIMTRGGTKFNLPMDQQVSRVFPMVEGILIEFYIKPEIKFHEILYYQNNKNAMQIQSPRMSFQMKKNEGRYCYGTLTRHPLNPIKILGQYKNQQISSWFKTEEQVVMVCENLPLIVSYNNQLKRNAFHVLIANMAQIHKEYQFAFLPTHSFSLSSLQENFHYEVMTVLLHEESTSGAPIKKVVVNKSTKKGFITLYAITVQKQVKVYEISFFGTANSSTKLLKRIQNVDDISEASLYNSFAFSPRPFRQTNKETELMFEILNQQILRLKDSATLISNIDQTLSTYHNGEKIISKSFSTGSQQIAEVIQDPFDSLVLKSLEICLAQETVFASILRNYCTGQSLSTVLVNALELKREIFMYLHLLYQELKLYELMNEQRKRLGPLLAKLAQKIGKKEYLDYYARQGYMLKKEQTSNSTFSSLQIEQVYDIFDLLDKLIFEKPLINQNICCLYNRSKFIIRFFQILINGTQDIKIQACSKDDIPSNIHYQHGNEYLYRRGYPLLSQKVFHLNYFNKAHINQLLLNVKVQNKEQKAFIYLIKHNQNTDEITTYPLAIRAVFNWLLRQMRKNLPFSLYEDIPQLGFNLIGREDLYKNILLYKKKTLIPPYPLQKPSFDNHIKTLIHTSTSQEYFLTSNASQMNKTNNELVFEEVDRLLSSASQIKIKQRDIESIPQEKWELQSQNILMKFANRKLAVMIGQGAFNLATSTSFITDIIKIPKINLNGVMPSNLKIVLDLKDDKQSIVFWPQFHAGMVAGLRLSRHVIPLSEDHLKTWIFYQKPDSPKRDHSGFLLSLGLQGYLKCFSPTDIYQYLKPNNQFTSVAILLGISASNIARSDDPLTKALFLHIPALLPPSIDVQIPINVQTSALIGLGLMHKGTCNRTMTQTTLSQIGKLPRSDKCMEREGYSLAAGWALGMVCLGMRDKKEIFRDLQIQERLIRFIEGGKMMQPPQSITSTYHINQNKTSSIKQGTNVNLHATAPSALLAISLMYLKSNNKQLADRITIPNSFSTIQQCNQNHILMKTVAKNLIMWKNIGQDEDFVISQVPQIIKFIYDSPLNKVYERYYLVYNVSEIDYQTVTSIYVNVTTGAILSMALKYAGSGNVNVVSTIKKHIEHLKSMKIIKCQFANDPMNKNCIDQYQLFTLLCCSILSLSIVMAGTCDIESLKIIRVIRKKFQDSKVFHYGFSMAINMAIGFIFLGYGNYTFNTNDMSIAALLISVYPQFPSTPSENRWHLQALRHFYVLAMQEKIFHAVDVDTNKVVNVMAQMDFEIDGKIYTQNLQTPVLLQQNKKLVQMRVRDSDYFDVDFAFQDAKKEPKAIYIKRKYFKDINPKLLKPQNPLVTAISLRSVKDSLSQEIRFKSIFMNDLEAQNPQKRENLMKYLLKNTSSEKLSKISKKLQQQKPNIEKELYYKLLKEDKLEMFQIYLTLKLQLKNQIITSKNNDNNLILSNIPLLLNFQKWQGINEFNRLIQEQLNLLQKKLFVQNREALMQYCVNPLENKLQNETLYRSARLFRMPQTRDLINVFEAIKKIKDSTAVEALSMMFYLSFPESSPNCLNFLAGSYKSAVKNQK